MGFDRSPTVSDDDHELALKRVREVHETNRAPWFDGAAHADQFEAEMAVKGVQPCNVCCILYRWALSGRI